MKYDDEWDVQDCVPEKEMTDAGKIHRYFKGKNMHTNLDCNLPFASYPKVSVFSTGSTKEPSKTHIRLESSINISEELVFVTDRMNIDAPKFAEKLEELRINFGKKLEIVREFASQMK